MINFIQAAAFLFGGFFISAAHAEDLNGSGKTGTPGLPGQSYSTRPRSNPRGQVTARNRCETTRGRSGIPGTDAGAGKNGADFNLQISDVGQILVTGTMSTLNSTGRRDIEDIYKTSTITGVVQISSRGGRGGEPGQGGNGEGAQQGQDSQQDSHSEKENGGNGCDAGTAGLGAPSGSPANGGNGGNIKIRLSSDDTHLLLAISTDTAAGKPSDVIANGKDGEGASGGLGGKGYYDDRSGMYPTGRKIDEPGCTPRSAGNYGTGRYENESGCTPTSGHYEKGSCSWKTHGTNDTETTTYECDEVYVSGKSCRQVEVTQYKSEIRCRQVPEEAYKKVIVRTEDGRRGDSSPRTYNPMGLQPSASAGKNGTTVFEIVDANSGQVSKYLAGDLLDLEMLSYDIVDEDSNGVLEPGERVSIVNLKIRNHGAIDYKFTKAQTLIFLKTSSWLVADPQSLTVPQIRAGETLTLKNPNLHFTIRSNSFKADSTAPVWSETIAPHNRITRIERSWGKLSLEKSFYITFPVKLTSFEVPASIEAGQTAAISWSIQNLSKSDIPSLGTYARTVLTELDFQSQNMSAEDLSLRLEKNESSGNLKQGLVQMISGLGANETRVIQGTLKVSEAVEPYSTASLGLGLKINSFGTQDLLTLQEQNREIRITRVYRTRKTDDVLLVLTDSNRTIYRAWMSLFQTLGLQGNIWDLSIDGGFSLFNSLNGGSDLGKDFQNKSIVLPKLVDKSGINQQLSDAHRQLYTAAKEKNNSLYMIGYAVGDYQSLLEKTLYRSKTIKYASKDDYLAKVKSGYSFSDSEVHEISVAESYFFVRTPRMDTLLAQKNELENYLQQTFPNEFFKTSIVFSPKQTHAGLFGSSYTLGSIVISKGVDSSKSRLVLLPTQQEQNSPIFIAGLDNARALCLSLNSEARIKILKKTLTGSNIAELYLPVALSCIQHDIYQEWFQKSEKIERTRWYLEQLPALYSQSRPGAQRQLNEFAGMLMTMAQDGGFSTEISQTLSNSAFIKQFSPEAMEVARGTQKRLQEKAKSVVDKTGTSKTLLVKKMILNAINPRAQTSGVDANDLSK